MSSSIFSSTPYRAEFNEIEKHTLNFIDNIMDENEDALKAHTTNPEDSLEHRLMNNEFNAMSLFAFRGDGQLDSFANAFSAKQEQEASPFVAPNHALLMHR